MPSVEMFNAVADDCGSMQSADTQMEQQLVPESSCSDKLGCSFASTAAPDKSIVPPETPPERFLAPTGNAHSGHYRHYSLEVPAVDYAGERETAGSCSSGLTEGMTAEVHSVAVVPDLASEPTCAKLETQCFWRASAARKKHF